MSNEHAEILLPGRGRPIDYIPRAGDESFMAELFPNALNDDDDDDDESRLLPPITLRELTMLQLINTITDKPDWNLKIKNPEIVAKWKEEALGSGADITPKMVDWCLDELRYKETLVVDTANPPPIVVYNGDVVKSDNALSAEFKETLKKAVTKFENTIPTNRRDWHPGSDEKVWDLVHPSLFPLVYKNTRILEKGTTTLQDCIESCGKGEVAKDPTADDADSSYSNKFQWLPCEVDISEGTPRVTSYINNLHPLHEKPLYTLIESVIEASIALWDLTLAPLRTYFERDQRIKYSQVEHEHEDEDEDEDRDEDEERARGSEIRPEPDVPFTPLNTPPKFSLKDEYGKRGLQVIVKLANIELTPEKPEYGGGSWHIEGQLNEHIVATSIYYYSCSNITTSSLAFRQLFSTEELEEVSYEQDDHHWLSSIFGCQSGGSAVQEVGSVETREGRLVTFPNILHHRVGPFKLTDPTKPGHRKIVALFLVDPHIKIISTAHVPCQRQDWWWEAIQEPIWSAPDNLNNPNAVRLPRELQDHILEGVDFPFSMQVAKAFREELMEERKDFVIDFNDTVENEFVISLCEH